MKKIIVIVSILLFCNYGLMLAQQKSGFVSISGKLAHFSNQVEVEDMSEFEYLQPQNAERMILPEDSNGTFHIRFSLAAPNYFRIGRNALYLSPGDDLKVFIDKNDPNLATFTGKGNEANMYLRSNPFPKGGSFIEAGAKAQATPVLTIEYILKAAANRKLLLDSVRNVSKEFKRLEVARIKADLINSLRCGEIPFYRPRAIQKDSLKMKEYEKEYVALSEPLVKQYSTGFTDASLLKLVVYRDVADLFTAEPDNAKALQQIKDWFTASDVIYKMKKESDKEKLATFSVAIDSITTLIYKNAVRSTLSGLLKFGKGDVAADFEATDMNGNTVALNSLKGKVIYIDLWATWCGPCLKEMPQYELLKERYKDRTDIVFVSLSIDDNEALWKNNVSSRNAKGYQWMINRNKLSAYNIVGIPRTLIIYKNFRMVDMNGPLPSSKNLDMGLEILLK